MEVYGYKMCVVVADNISPNLMCTVHCFRWYRYFWYSS